MRIAILLIFSVLITTCTAQTKRALFLGNSYTAVNNLPLLTSQVANAMGDTLIFDSNTPGGYTLQGHSTNPTSISKISQGGWDYVILQEQSQLPSFPDSQVETEVFPYAEILDTTIHFYSPCAETVFYMTWGRKNGDAGNCASWPPVCTYQGMDSLLNLRYRQMAEMNEALVSPVGAVWHYIRDTYPEIELYASDGSHPSAAGTYAGACTFYTLLFEEDPNTIPFDHTLNPIAAANIREAVHTVVYQDLSLWYVGDYDLQADFNYALVNSYTYTFTNLSVNASDIIWSLDGSTDEQLSYTFPGPGDYEVGITAMDACDTISTFLTITIAADPTDIEEFDAEIDFVIPSPVDDWIRLTEHTDGMELVIWDTTGKTIALYGPAHERDIPAMDLATGHYFISAHDMQGRVIRGRFFKN